MTLLTSLQTDKTALHRTRLVSAPLGSLQPGEALMRIDRLAVTTNNITYAAFGDTPHLRYWSFFPTGAEGWGHMPAWGFAEVVRSTVDGLAEGERFYGYWPIASHLIVQPVRVGERGFYDGTPHRLDLTSAYNQYQRTTTDAAYRAELENFQMLLRPLFITSFMLADFLEDNAFFGARQIVFSSASSKTAYGTAFCLEGRDVQRVGLTSGGNRAFVEGLGCYGRAVTYDELESLDPAVPTLYVDFSGDAALRSRVHAHFGASLVHDCYAGSAQTHAHISESKVALPGPAPQPYFAPNQIRKRNADWGAAEVTRRFNAAQLAFITRVNDASAPWMKVREHRGLSAAQDLVDALGTGRVDPNLGHVVVLD
ncbi:DUF2855 family protein [Rhizobacter sp. LjRoot28]|uniref:DUF2855 family protein n=1 Tax=Rhizobacter sp. LjRoot28 TaxID=3342309 RepID=UPI003ED047FD